MSQTTVQVLSDLSPMPFGKYRGKAMQDVPAKYLLWLYDSKVDHPAVRAYIIDNLQVLRQEAGQR